MNPFYFGTGQRRLFGIYTPAQAAAGAGVRAVVLCAPWGHEYLGAHRSIRHLATLLSAAGLHVLRFDYFGTGDSAGDMRQASLDGWRSDIETAIDELKDTAGAAKVGLAGLRLGATLAASVAAKRSRDVDALALWDPIASGEKYMQELVRAELEMRGVGRTDAASPPGDGVEREVGGFPITPQMSLDLRGIDLGALQPAVAARTLAVVSDAEFLETTRAALDGRCRAPAQVEHIAAPPAWVENVSFRTGAVPVKVLQRVAEWFR